MDVVARAVSELESVGMVPTGTHVRTGEVRRISTKLFRELPDRSKDHVFSVCE